MQSPKRIVSEGSGGMPPAFPADCPPVFQVFTAVANAPPPLQLALLEGHRCTMQRRGRAFKPHEYCEAVEEFPAYSLVLLRLAIL
jgi:hypothetical protein